MSLFPTVSFGVTGLRVSRAALGCGGPSRLGLRTHGDPDRARAVVRRAIDLGINIIDTAETYATEPIVGDLLADLPPSDRDDLVVCTKKSAFDADEHPVSATDFAAGIDASLRRLKTDRIDLFHLHGLVLTELDHALAELYPVLERARDQGKIRFLGVSEAFVPDPTHEMLRRVLPMGLFDAVMLGFNAVNQSARHNILPLCHEHGVGTLCMFAVRRALTDPAKLRDLITELVNEQLVDASDIDLDDPLGFLANAAPDLPHHDAIIDACYRFCRDEPGIDTVLTGTGSVEHLEANARALAGPSLPTEHAARLRQIFSKVRDHTCN